MAGQSRRPGDRARARDAQSRRSLDRLAGLGRRGPGAVRHRAACGWSRSACSPDEVRTFYEGFCNATLWPLYHDVIAPPEFHRSWWEAYVAVNRRFAEAAAAQAARGATVWVHDYQLQLVPGMLAAQRPDVRIGFFNHIPFPGYEIFAQLPWRRQIVDGLLGADLIGFQRQQDAANFLRACRRAARLPTRGSHVQVPADAGQSRRGGRGTVRAAAFPISIDTAGFGDARAGRDDVQARAAEIRTALGEPADAAAGRGPARLHQGDPAPAARPTASCSTRAGWRRRRRCSSRWPAPAGSGWSSTACCATRSRRRSAGSTATTATLGQPAVHYLHQSYPREEMAALYVAADVMLVTPLRDGMNLVAKEYVACRLRRERRAGAERVHRRRGRAAAARSWSTRTTSRA